MITSIASMKQIMNNPPLISVVTPSFNQAEYLERTILSVIHQNYPNIEYIIIDGGSCDGSLDIIKKYENHISYWISEPDNGQVDALNKGFLHATGDWLCWQNSDDVFLPGAFAELANAIENHPEAGLVVGNIILIDKNDRIIREQLYVNPNHNALLAEGMLMANQAAFWRRDVHARAGVINEQYSCSFDYDWFLRITNISQGVHINRFWGALRQHDSTKSFNLVSNFLYENERILAGRRPSIARLRLFQLQRLFQLLRYGEIKYVIRGIFRRMNIFNG